VPHFRVVALVSIAQTAKEPTCCDDMANGKLKLIGSGRYQAADNTHLNPSLPKAGVFSFG
jgi:hypothetical protein